ncbi:MAG: PAS domain S-box-containing protein, partial [bacterium]
FFIEELEGALNQLIQFSGRLNKKIIILEGENESFKNEQRRLQKKISIMQKKDKQVIDSINLMEVGFIKTNNNSITIDLNHAMAKILGRRREEALGAKIFDFLDEENAQIARDEIQKRYQGKPSSYEVAFLRKDKTLLNCLVYATPIFDHQGVKVGTFAIIANIAEQRDIEKQLTIERDKAEEASNAKSQFLTNISREIRTPLNSVLGFSQVLQREVRKVSVPDHFHTYLSNIQASGEHLLELINNILELSSLETGKSMIIEENLNFNVLVKSLFQVNQSQAVQKNIDFQFSILPSTPNVICSDRKKINQIIMNIMASSLTFTRKGQKVFIEFGSDDKNIIVKCRNSGLRTSVNQIRRILNSLETGDSRISKRCSSAGLKLAVTQKMIKLLGGNLKFEKNEEKDGGMITTISIPFNKELEYENLEEEVDTDIANFAKDSRILLVEDNLITRKLMNVLFKNLGLMLQYAENGMTAIRKVFENTPELILMDMHLPDMDGIEITKLIRENVAFRKIPIVAFSADAFEEQQTRAFQAGVSEYLLKPIDIRLLLPILLKYLRQDESEEKIQHIENKDVLTLPKHLTKIIIKEFQELSTIPHFFTGKISRQIRKMKILIDGYDSHYHEILDDLEDASFTKEHEKTISILYDVLK